MSQSIHFGDSYDDSTLSHQSTKPLLLNKITFTGAEFSDKYYNSLVAPLLQDRQSNLIPLVELNDELDKIHATLLTTGLFKSVNVKLDVSEDITSTITKGESDFKSSLVPVNAKFTLEQLPLYKYSSSSKTSDTAASASFQYLEPNLLKQACSLLVDVNVNYDLINNSVNTKSWDLTLLKPLEHYKNLRAIFNPVISSVDAKSWANHEQYTVGALLGLQSTKNFNCKTFGPSVSVLTTGISFTNRQIRNVANSASDSIRAGAGSDFKIAANFNYKYDSRKLIGKFATQGILLDFTNELAGYNTADVFAQKNNHTPLESFNKTTFRFNSFKSIFNNAITAEFDLEAGTIFQKSADSVPIIDKFTLGGLHSLRGFKLNSVGLKDGDDFIGGTSSYKANFSLYSKLHNVPSAQPLRLHSFLNIGDVFDLECDQFKKYALSGDIFTKSAVSTGVGLIYKGDNAIADLSYNIPLKVRSNDIAKPGFGFSVALKFA